MYKTASCNYPIEGVSTMHVRAQFLVATTAITSAPSDLGTALGQSLASHCRQCASRGVERVFGLCRLASPSPARSKDNLNAGQLLEKRRRGSMDRGLATKFKRHSTSPRGIANMGRRGETGNQGRIHPTTGAGEPCLAVSNPRTLGKPAHATV